MCKRVQLNTEPSSLPRFRSMLQRLVVYIKPHCRQLVKSSAGEMSTSFTLAKYAADLAKVAMVQLLLSKGADVDAGVYYSTAFHLLPSGGVDVNARGGRRGTALQIAESQGNVDLIDLLLVYGARVDFEGGHFGCYYDGAWHAVVSQLSKGADGNADGNEYGSLLNATVMRGSWDMVRVLLCQGVTPDSHRLEGPDEEWLKRLERKDEKGAVKRYLA
ncbi:hypothetical protein CP532_0839 [Ophiocordyceps camponoti-leonardi (nom. inval.)]|nr:hypothetical protein CP532_0839 [Ophiocordyceps camponoti-leonardi (nom. inval.)]